MSRVSFGFWMGFFHHLYLFLFLVSSFSKFVLRMVELDSLDIGFVKLLAALVVFGSVGFGKFKEERKKDCCSFLHFHFILFLKRKNKGRMVA